jgi:hypothetical protein
MNENPLRGEVEVTIGGKAYVMRPSYSAIVKIERTLSTRLLKLMVRLQSQDIGVEDLATIIACAVNANPDNHVKLTLDEVGEEVLAGGFVPMLKTVADFLQCIAAAGPSKKLTEDAPSGNA